MYNYCMYDSSSSCGIPLVFCRMMEEKVRKVPRRLVGWRDNNFAQVGEVGEVGTGVWEGVRGCGRMWEGVRGCERCGRMYE